MEVSTAEFYEAVKELANGVTENANTNAKKISDYVEQAKQTNYTTLKDVFLTKDDKVDILQKISDLPVTLKDAFLTKDDKAEILQKISDLPVTLKQVFLTKDDKVDILQKISDLPVTLKQVFLTKDDKVELVKEIHGVRNTMDANFKWSVGMFVSVLITLFVLLFKSFAQ